MVRLLLSLSLLALSAASLTSACPNNITFTHPLAVTVPPSFPVYTSADSNSTLSALIGSSFGISLSYSSGTGYSWQISEGYVLEDNAAGLQFERCGELKPKAAKGTKKAKVPRMLRTGATKVEQWVFTATKAGKQYIPFQFARPWLRAANAAADPDLIFTIEVANPLKEADEWETDEIKEEAEEIEEIEDLEEIVEAEIEGAN